MTAHPQRPRPFLDAAESAAHWIASTAQVGREGTRWPVDPAHPDACSDDLYSGGAGIVLFLLELWRATGGIEHLDAARAGADRLLEVLDSAVDELDSGLYSGLAGIGYALLEAHRLTGEPRYQAGVESALALLGERATATRSGVTWDGVHDLISGSAGIGLFLLAVDRELGPRAARELALAAGRGLLDEAIAAPTGVKWAGSVSDEELMPNLSHGTAGIALFLAALHQRCGDPAALEAAVAGATYLTSVADTADGGFCVFHHEPGGEDLYYLGWCHGPAGTARLFEVLHAVTGDRQWMNWLQRAARTILSAGVPRPDAPDSWDNVGLCCGSAAVARFCIELFRRSGKEACLELATRVAEDILRRATVDAGGLCWIHAEERLEPEARAAQTGLMQGAAGIGLVLLWMDGLQAGRPPSVLLPDEPAAARPPGYNR